MAVELVCPNPRCGASYRLSDADLARSNRCRRCGEPLSRSGSSPSGKADPPGSTARGRPSNVTAELTAGSTFGRYQIVRRLGQGGMGTVYLAHDSRLDRQVALKIPSFSPQDGPESLERFYREARAAAVLDHPNLCPIYDIGEVDDAPYMTMAYVEGRPLSDLIDPDAPTSQRQVAAVVRKLAVALQAAHDRGVIHRDLKPQNILVSKKRELMIVDFGLARRQGVGDARLTHSGMILGTPAYMPPEQISGDSAAMGPGCDIYSLGVIFYELLTGRPPFEGPTALVLGRIMVTEPDPPSRFRADLDPRLQAICLKAMAKKVKDRYASMSALAAALTEYLREPETTATPASSPVAAPVPAPAAASPRPRPSGGEKLVEQVFANLVDEPPSSVNAVQPASIAEAKDKAGVGWSRRGLRWLAAGTSLFLLLLILILILYLQTDRGGDRIERSSPSSEAARSSASKSAAPAEGKAPQGASSATLSIPPEVVDDPRLARGKGPTVRSRPPRPRRRS